MAKYQIVDTYVENNNIRVIVENEEGTREMFSYPVGHGYGDINMNGEIRAVAITLKRLKDREEKIEKASNESEIENINNKRNNTKNRIFHIDKDDNGKKIIKEIDSEGNVLKTI